MFKKIICFGIFFIMVFSLAACNQGLAAYKEEAKQQIENYAADKSEENYSSENWAAICGIVAYGKATIDAASNKDAVDTVVNEAKTLIDDVLQKEEEEMTERTKIEGIECYPKIVVSDTYYNNLSKSKTAYEDTIPYFTENGKYTDDFGGVFIDNNGMYNICVVGNREPIKSDYLVYKKVDNSFNFLEIIVGEISEIAHDFTIWRAGTSVSQNAVVIYLKDGNKLTLLIEYLKSKNLYQENALKILIEEKGIILN